MKKLLLTGLLGLATLTAQAADSNLLINGEGATFPAPIYQKWFSEFNKANPTIQINYNADGSGAGVKAISEESVTFGASDGPMSDADLAKAKGGKLFHLPTVAGAVVLSYNLPGNPKLTLDADTIVGIFQGKIVKWNDPALVKLNPALKEVTADIAVAHRSDGSGTTYIFTDYLSTVSKEWKDKVGTNKDLGTKWPTGQGGKGNDGVAGLIKNTPGAIGYVELIYALQNSGTMAYANVKNAAGKVITPSLASVTAALKTAKIPDDFRFSMVNAPGDDAYPICGATWLLVYQQQKDPVKGKALVDFLKWAYTDSAQKMANDLNYASLPADLVARVKTVVDTIKYEPVKN